MRNLVAIGFTVLAFSAGISQASAQTSGQAAPVCDCQTPNAPGLVTKVSGSVDISRPGSAGLVPLKIAGSPVTAGTQLVTGADGSATIQVGLQCTLDIASNSEVIISKVGNDLCVQLGGTNVVGGAPTTPATVVSPTPPAISGPLMVGVVAGGAGIAYAIGELGDDGDGSASN